MHGELQFREHFLEFAMHGDDRSAMKLIRRPVSDSVHDDDTHANLSSLRRRIEASLVKREPLSVRSWPLLDTAGEQSHPDTGWTTPNSSQTG